MKPFNPGDTFKILKETAWMVDIWSELRRGSVFEVLETKDNGVTQLAIIGTDIIVDVLGTEYWCFYLPVDIEDGLIEKIDIDKDSVIRLPGYITLDHFQGKTVKLTTALHSLASQENCDSEEYDLMVAAAEYIVYLENKLREK